MPDIAVPRVYLHDGNGRRLARLTHVSAVNRAYKQARRTAAEQASFTVATSEPAMDDLLSIRAGVIVVIESTAYVHPWVGWLVRLQERRASGTIEAVALGYESILAHRYLGRADVESITAGDAVRGVLRETNALLPTGIVEGVIDNGPSYAILPSDANVAQTLDQITEDTYAEWWLSYEVTSGEVTPYLNYAEARGTDKFRTHQLTDGGNCLIEDWTIDGQAGVLATTVVGGLGTAAEAFVDRARGTRIASSVGTFGAFRQRFGTKTAQDVAVATRQRGRIHGYQIGEDIAQVNPVTARQDVAVLETVRTNLTDVAQARLESGGLDRAVRCVMLHDPNDADAWSSIEAGDVVRLRSGSAFVNGINVPARVLGLQPMEELGVMNVVLQILLEV